MLQARRQLQKLKCSENGCCTTDEPRSPTTASIAASVEVQVGESLSNLRLSDDSAAAAATSAQHRSSQRSRPQAFRVKVYTDHARTCPQCNVDFDLDQISATDDGTVM